MALCEIVVLIVMRDEMRQLVRISPLRPADSRPLPRHFVHQKNGFFFQIQIQIQIIGES